MPFVSRRIRNNITGKVYSDPEMRLLARRWHCGKSASGDGSNHKDGGHALPFGVVVTASVRPLFSRSHLSGSEVTARSGHEQLQAGRKNSKNRSACCGML